MLAELHEELYQMQCILIRFLPSWIWAAERVSDGGSARKQERPKIKIAIKALEAEIDAAHMVRIGRRVH